MDTTVLRVFAVAGLLLGVAACEDDHVDVPTAAELADRLIEVDTFEGDWSINVPDDAPEGAETGIVPEEMQGLLPQMELCDDAGQDARAAAEGLRWMAFRQLDAQVDDPIDPPEDTTGHLVFVQEFLLSGHPDEIETTFGLLRDGMAACLGEIPASDEGPGVLEAMEVPDVGHDRYGVLTTFVEAGDWAEWRLHNALVRDDAVLASIVIVDIRADAEPFYTLDQIGEMVQTAVDLL